MSYVFTSDMLSSRVFPSSSHHGNSHGMDSSNDSGKVSASSSNVYYSMRVVVQSRPYIQEEVSEGSLFGLALSLSFSKNNA